MSKTTQNSGKQWSRNDDSKLKDLANKNTPTGLIAWNLKRTEDAIRNRASSQGVSLKPTNKSPYNRRK